MQYRESKPQHLFHHSGVCMFRRYLKVILGSQNNFQIPSEHAHATVVKVILGSQNISKVCNSLMGGELAS